MLKNVKTTSLRATGDGNSLKGFTLIELLIVIVIIGILAGVLIAVINPSRQQNRARDANVIASINKVVLSSQGYVSAYGAAPDEVQMFNGLQLATQSGTTCGTAGAFDCLFTITGNNLPTTCGTNSWSGDDLTSSATVCQYRYYRNAGATPWATDRFRIYAKSFGLAGRVFVYDTAVGQIYNCNATVNLDAITDITTSSSCSL